MDGKVYLELMNEKMQLVLLYADSVHSHTPSVLSDVQATATIIV